MVDEESIVRAAQQFGDQTLDILVNVAGETYISLSLDDVPKS